jgi:hypothetical protein
LKKYTVIKPILDIVGNIHQSARLVAQQAKELEDEEEVIDPEEEARKEAELLEKKKRKKEKRKRKMKLGMSKEQASIDSSDDEDSEEKRLEAGLTQEQELTSDMDKLKRTNMSQLRIPFNSRVNYTYRLFFMYISIGMLVLFTLIMTIVIPPYSIVQDIKMYGTWDTSVTLNSILINFMAFVLDAKETIYSLKHTVPVQDKFIPLITLDLSQEGSALYVGSHVVKLKDITEVNTFSWHFSYVLTIGALLGNIPWCMLMLLLRELYLPFSINRVLTPALGCWLIIRALPTPSASAQPRIEVSCSSVLNRKCTKI